VIARTDEPQTAQQNRCLRGALGDDDLEPDNVDHNAGVGMLRKPTSNSIVTLMQLRSTPATRDHRAHVGRER
jgi:hypothetical protein